MKFLQPPLFLVRRRFLMKQLFLLFRKHLLLPLFQRLLLFRKRLLLPLFQRLLLFRKHLLFPLFQRLLLFRKHLPALKIPLLPKHNRLNSLMFQRHGLLCSQALQPDTLFQQPYKPLCFLRSLQTMFLQILFRQVLLPQAQLWKRQQQAGASNGFSFSDSRISLYTS